MIAKAVAARPITAKETLLPSWLQERKDFSEGWKHASFVEMSLGKIVTEREQVDIDMIVQWLEKKSELARVLNCTGKERIFFPALAKKAHLKRLAPGDSLFAIGDESGDEFYIVHRGIVDVLDASGAVIATIGAGRVFGYAALVQMSKACDRARTASIACNASGECCLFVLNASVFYNEMETCEFMLVLNLSCESFSQCARFSSSFDALAETGSSRISAVARDMQDRVDIFAPLSLTDLGRIACFLVEVPPFAAEDVIVDQVRFIVRTPNISLRILLTI